MQAIVTGGTKGIGKSIVEKLLDLGNDVLFVARNQQMVQMLEQRWKEQYPSRVIIGCPLDLTQSDAVSILKAFTTEIGFSPQILVNNLGIYTPDDVENINFQNLNKTLKTNFLLPIQMTQAFLSDIQQKNTGHIFNICSVLSKNYRPEAASYTISKQALYAYTKMLGQRLRDTRIKVTAILPASVYTASWEDTDVNPEKLIQPSDVAEAIAFALKTSKSTWIDEIIIQTTDKNY